MKSIFFSGALALILSAQASACDSLQTSADCPEPIQRPTVLCINECEVVHYWTLNSFSIAESTVNNYPVMGWSGPCFGACPDIWNQAFSDLEMNAKRANRSMRFGE